MTKEEIYERWKNTKAGEATWARCDQYTLWLAGWACCEYAASINLQVNSEDKIPYATIVNITNSILNKGYKVSEVNKKFIRARWNEGFREADFEKVCRLKLAQWGKDPAMCGYLRPETLYGTKMEAYCNEKLSLTTIPDYL